MISRLEHGTIVDKIAGEDLVSNHLYIVNPNNTEEIISAKSPDDWLTNQVVLVYNYCGFNYNGEYFIQDCCDFLIQKGEHCRCWIVYIVI